jgi:hypothetical protein
MNGAGIWLPELVCAVSVEIMSRKINTVNKKPLELLEEGYTKLSKF